jgi:uncharacterized membrane protein YjjP (DUF1212 family)
MPQKRVAAYRIILLDASLINRETPVEVGLLAALLVVVYLIVLNGFLNGLYKGRIDATLSCLLLGIIAIVFVAVGWKGGLTSIALCFIAAGIVRPLARTTARFIYAHPPKR